MTFFFDRNIGIGIPKALLELKRLPFVVAYHQELFGMEERFDDEWLSQVGAWGWFVVAQDYHFHARPVELDAIRQHNVGCFYLWGAEAPQWDTFRCFARAYEKIVTIANTQSRPFIYLIHHSGTVSQLPLTTRRIPFRRSPRRLPSP